jgi:hypothetical protein
MPTPLFYCHEDTYYRYSDGAHVFYIVDDSNGRHLYRYDG